MIAVGVGVSEPEIDVHAKAIGDGCERPDDLVTTETEPVQVELDALEEHGIVGRGAGIDVLLGVHDVAVVVGQELCGRSDHSGLVRA